MLAAANTILAQFAVSFEYIGSGIDDFGSGIDDFGSGIFNFGRGNYDRLPAALSMLAAAIMTGCQ